MQDTLIEREKTMLTTWDVWTYDVWGNAKDGFDVNDRSCVCRNLELRLKIEKANKGTPNEFEHAFPSTRQIREALGLTGWRKGINTDGDDTHIYVEASHNERPIGELICTSHDSLSPIHKASIVCRSSEIDVR